MRRLPPTEAPASKAIPEFVPALILHLASDFTKSIFIKVSNCSFSLGRHIVQRMKNVANQQRLGAVSLQG